MSLRKRIVIVLYILSLTISLFIFSFIMSRNAINIECTSYSFCAVDGGNIYYAQNLRDTGIIFKMDGGGNVSKMIFSSSLKEDRVIAISVKDGKLYAVLSGFVVEDDAEDEDGIISNPTYRIVCFDNNLIAQTQSPRFAIDADQVLSGFSAEPTGLFMTTISMDGSQIKVYAVDESALKDVSEKQEDSIKIETVRSKSSAEGRFFSDALYVGGTLNVRTDKDAPEGVFVTDPFIKEALSKIKLTIGQMFSLYSIYCIWYVAALLVWFIVLYLIVRLFEKKNRSFYYLFIAETTIAIVVGVGVYAVTYNYESARETEHSRFAVTSLIGLADVAGIDGNVNYSDSSFYDSERYQNMRRELTNFVKRDGNSDIFYDVFVYRLRDNVICTSASGRNLQPINEIFGNDILQLSEDIYKGYNYAAADFKIDGQDYRSIAITSGVGLKDYALVGIINKVTTDASVFVDNSRTLFIFIAAFALASAFTVLVWMLHMRDLTVLEEALSNTALGKSIPDKPVTIGYDVKDMWDSVSEIHKKMEEIEYSKIRILEAYYRFAPKNVEKILGKKSIIEVQNGDSAKISGTIAKIAIDIKDGLMFKQLNNVMGNIGAYQRGHDCIIVSKTPDMSTMQMAFMQNEKQIVSILVSLYNSGIREGFISGLSTILFFDQFRFGVMGSDKEAATYLSGDNQELIDKMSEFVSRLSLGLVISDAIMDRENITTPLRFIGYSGNDASGKMTRLFEVLDACPPRIRAEKISTLEKYNDALKAYYEKDFYIARTKFSDILKETPDDTLIKWYVFESDKYLNEAVEGDDYKLLFK